MEPISFSFIVINRNNEKYIEKCISSLSRIPLKGKEIIVVDDYSTDKSIESIRSHTDKILRLSQNKGIAITRAEGLKESIGQYIIFIDSDIEITSFNQDEIINTFHSNQKIIGIVGRYDSPKSDSYNWNCVLDARRQGIQFKNERGFMFGIKNYTTFSGGFCIYEKQRLLKLSVEGQIGMASEDLLQQLELLQDGYMFYYLPTFHGIHHHFRSFRELISKAKSEARGEIWLLSKVYEKRLNIPKFDPIYTFPGLLVLSILFLNPVLLLLSYITNISFILLHPSKSSLILLPYQIFKDLNKIVIVFKEIYISKWTFSKISYIIFTCTLNSAIGKINWITRVASKGKISI